MGNVTQYNRLVVEWYADANPARRQELAECLAENLANPFLTQVVLLCADDRPVPEHPKIIVVRLPKRGTFRAMIQAANEQRPGPADVTVLANSDIALDDSLGLLAEIDFRGYCLACSRWENGALYRANDSQDFWVFQGPIRDVFGDFSPGTPGCDNRFAYELKKAKYRLRNPAENIRGHHRHASGFRVYHTDKTRVPGPYWRVEPGPLDFPRTIDGGGDGPERILHIAMGALTNGEVPDALHRALAAQGQYRTLCWRQFGVKQLQQKIVEAARDLQPTITFMQVQTDDVVHPETIRQIPGAILNWTGDVREPILKMFYQLAPKAIPCFSNASQPAIMRGKGVRAEYLQNAVDEAIFTPHGEPAPAPDIIFMGNDYGAVFPLGALRREMVARLRARYGSRFGVFGRFHGATGNLNNDMRAEAAHYRGCQIAINLSQFSLSRYSSDRLFRALGSGAFVLSHRYPDIDQDFVEGEHLAAWAALDELERQIGRYLDAPAERQRIAQQGCELVHAKHTWSARTPELLAIAHTKPVGTISTGTAVPVVTHCDKGIGDNLAHLQLVVKLAQQHPDRRFIHHCHDTHLGQLRAALAGIPNVELDNLHYVPPGSVDAWKGAGRFWYNHPRKNQYLKFYIEQHARVARQMGFDSPLTGPFDFLFDWPAVLGGRDEPFDFLIINSRPLSGQWRRHDDVKWNELIGQLCRSHKVIATAPTPAPVRCTFNEGLDVAAIGRLSQQCRCIIFASTGPSWLTFNIWNQDSVQLRVALLDEERLDGLSSNLVQTDRLENVGTILREKGMI